MPADHENILSLERFGSLLSSITCTNTSIVSSPSRLRWALSSRISLQKLVFKDQNAFLYAQKEWNWVNVANHTFVIVAGAHQCGWNSYRLPFVVNGATYDNSTKTANLAAVVSEWKRVAHTCEMWVGQIPASSPAPSRFMPRDFAETLTVDFEHTLPANWSSWTFPLHIDNVTVTAECLDCGTHGSFVWQFHFSTVLFVPTGVSLTLQANGVGISVTPALHIEADLATQHDFPTVKLGTIPIDGLTIPGGILDLGPEIVVNAGGSFGPVSADATVSAGVELVLDSNPSLDIGLTSPSFHSSGSWIPKLQQIPFTIDAEVKGAAEIFLQFSAQFSLEALGKLVDSLIDELANIRSQIKASRSASFSSLLLKQSSSSMKVSSLPSITQIKRIF